MGEKQTESVVLHISDAHYGKSTRTFGPDVFKQRMDALGERMAGIKDLLGGGYNLPELVVCCTGDLNDGTDIYAGQPHEQAESDVEEQASQVATYLHGWLKRQKELWGSVRFEAVPGNHGRVGKYAAVTANWDKVAYRYLKLLCGDSISVNFPGRGESPFLRKIKVRGHDVLLYHGHEIRTYSSIPWYGMLLRLSKWATTGLYPIDLALMGHFHTVGDWPINRIRLLCTGTAVTNDDWALETLGWESQTAWWLFGVSDERPVTWQFRMEMGAAA